MSRHAQSCQIFDKLSPRNSLRRSERDLLLSSSTVKPFNDIDLHATFFDKLTTYQMLSEYALPTVPVESNTPLSVKTALRQLRHLVHRQKYPADFTRALILKDRFGAGGNHVYRITQDFLHNLTHIMRLHPQINFILQPFLAFDRGFIYHDRLTATDIRLIYHHGNLLQCYIRQAKAQDFRCNQHQGGELVYVQAKDIPAVVHRISHRIMRLLNKTSSLFALDFLISNSSHPYFLEGNVGPGISWDNTNLPDVKNVQKMIHSIVAEFADRISTPSALL